MLKLECNILTKSWVMAHSCFISSWWWSQFAAFSLSNCFYVKWSQVLYFFIMLENAQKILDSSMPISNTEIHMTNNYVRTHSHLRMYGYQSTWQSLSWIVGGSQGTWREPTHATGEQYAKSMQNDPSPGFKPRTCFLLVNMDFMSQQCAHFFSVLNY